MIELSGISLDLDGSTILSDVSFRLEKNRAVSIVGPNGAGKTTLLKCIMRLITGYRGRISLFGEDTRSLTPKNLARRISYVPQAGGVRVPYTVEEFVAMGRYPYRSPFAPLSADDRRATKSALELTGLTDFAGRMMDTLSGGERQAAFIAGALAQETPVMLLDEPDVFLDYRHQELVRRLLETITREKRSTIIQVTHDINRAAWSSSRVIALKSGRIAFDGTPEKLLQPDRLLEIYGTPFVIGRRPDIDRPIAMVAEGGME